MDCHGVLSKHPYHIAGRKIKKKGEKNDNTILIELSVVGLRSEYITKGQ
jgi:hypothetical protein